MSSSLAFTYNEDHEEEEQHYTYDGKEASKLLINDILLKL